jgi:rubrerythrin
MDIRKVYEYALQREHEGRDFFARNAARFGHAAVVGAFGMQLDAEGFFSQRAEAEMLDQTVIESMVPDLTVLRMAYLIERDFAEFYEMAAGRVEGDSAREALEMLARWERGHEELFKKMHDKAFEEYAGMPWGG